VDLGEPIFNLRCVSKTFCKFIDSDLNIFVATISKHYPSAKKDGASYSRAFLRLWRSVIRCRCACICFCITDHRRILTLYMITGQHGASTMELQRLLPCLRSRSASCTRRHLDQATK
jgi:hypothetical protein